jgi:hypothetical protein
VLGVWGLVLVGVGRADDTTKEKPVTFEQHSGYFESNKSGLKGPASYLAFTDRASFSKVFGVAFTMGKKPNVLPKGAFKMRLAVAAIKRGDAIWQYKVNKVTAKDGTLTVSYEASSRGGGGTARFASPLIVSVPKDKYKTVEFVENGKKVGSAKIE